MSRNQERFRFTIALLKFTDATAVMFKSAMTALVTFSGLSITICQIVITPLLPLGTSQKTTC